MQAQHRNLTRVKTIQRKESRKVSCDKVEKIHKKKTNEMKRCGHKDG